jgi:hypothetical protein
MPAILGKACNKQEIFEILHEWVFDDFDEEKRNRTYFIVAAYLSLPRDHRPFS